MQQAAVDAQLRVTPADLVVREHELCNARVDGMALGKFDVLVRREAILGNDGRLCPAIERRDFVLRSSGAGNRSVAPMDDVVIVGAEHLLKVVAVRRVLRPQIERSIFHDRRCDAVSIGEALRAQLPGREGIVTDEIVGKSEVMATSCITTAFTIAYVYDGGMGSPYSSSASAPNAACARIPVSRCKNVVRRCALAGCAP